MIETRPILSGVRVLDFGRYVAGPYCATLLGYLGAEVIRIEKIGGGEDRYIAPICEGGEGGVFFQTACNKRSLTLDPGSAAGREIVQRLVFSLVNEAAHILQEGIAARASDIDMVYITGYGFPFWRGGPMLYADSLGLFNVVQAMKRFATNPLDDAAFWQPAPLLARLAAEGKTFTNT